MGEILDVGTEAETCYMAGRDMNGLRGTVVCFNASNQRYTLELDSGEMMSLRARNVKALTFEDVSVEDEEDKKEQGEDKADEMDKEASKQKGEAKEPPKKPFSSLPKYSENFADSEADNTEKNEDVDVRKKSEGNIVDRFLYAVFGAFLDMSPSVLLLAVTAGYFANKFFNGGGSTYQSNGPSDEDSTSTTPNEGTASTTIKSHPDYDYYDDYYVYPRRFYRPYSWVGWHYWGWYGAMSGMFSVVVVAFFIWQFGTKKGETDFSWRNVKARVQQFSFWDVMMYGAFLEGALFFVMRLAQGGGGTRGMGGGRRR